MEIRHARSATRHRISRNRTRYVVETTRVIFRENAPEGSPLTDPGSCSSAPMNTGSLLEVMAIQTDTGGLLVIHAQRSRARYLELLKQGL